MDTKWTYENCHHDELGTLLQQFYLVQASINGLRNIIYPERCIINITEYHNQLQQILMDLDTKIRNLNEQRTGRHTFNMSGTREG